MVPSIKYTSTTNARALPMVRLTLRCTPQSDAIGMVQTVLCRNWHIDSNHR